MGKLIFIDKVFIHSKLIIVIERYPFLSHLHVNLYNLLFTSAIKLLIIHFSMIITWQVIVIVT